MKRLLTALVLGLSLMMGTVSSASAQNYYKGIDAYIKGNYATALREWHPLAELGVAEAQYLLGVMYANGEGVIRNYVMGHMWFNAAVSNGYSDARKKRDFITKAMTAAQIAEAQKLARECVHKNYKGC